MATMVTRYQAEDGTLHESREDAERHDAAGQILRMMESSWPKVGWADEMAAWIAAHLEELSTIHRYPILAKQTVDAYLGIKEEPEPISEEAAA